MKAENDLEQEAAKTDPFELLVTRFSGDVLLATLVRQLSEAHGKLGTPARRAFDGPDPSEPTAIFIAEALLCNQVALLEVRTANHARKERSVGRRLGESKLRQLEMVLVEAARLAIEAHMNLNEVG